MNNGLKLLLMAAGAIVTCIVVVVGFQLTKSGKSDTNKASEQYTSNLEEYDDVKLSAYDGVTVSGSDVVNCIKENGNLLELPNTEYNFSVIVVTKLGNTSTTYEDAGYSSTLTQNTKASNKTTAAYINPQGRFIGSIGRNTNGIINKITFTQQ